MHFELLLLVVCSQTPGCLFGFKVCWPAAAGLVLLKHVVVRQPYGSVLTSFVALTKVEM